MNQKKIKLQSVIEKKGRIRGSYRPPPDKSITHRALLLGSLSSQNSYIKNPLLSGDCLSTVHVLKQLGVKIEKLKNGWMICASGNKNKTRKYSRPLTALNCGNSGTTFRLLSGLLSAQPFKSILKGDLSLSRRPMKRVIEPLTKMGAIIQAKNKNFPPVEIMGCSNLSSIHWTLPVASAQVKSAILIAGCFTKGQTTVVEPLPSRDHTERMLKGMGASIRTVILSKKTGSRKIIVSGVRPLKGLSMTMPGDISSAAFFIAAAILLPGSRLSVKNVCLNPTRSGFLDAVKRMGGSVKIKNKHVLNAEPIGDLEVRSSLLRGITITKREIPLLIDEIPILSVLATAATGKTVIKGAEELRVKESDRLSALATELRKMGSNIQEKKDGLVITGRTHLMGSSLESYGDHRMAMSLAVAALTAKGPSMINRFNCVDISYPEFLKDLKKLIR